MDVNTFLLSLLHELSSLEFVEKVDLHTEVFILKGRAILKKNRFLQIYFFNEHTETTAFALIENSKRIWGIDYDNIRGWHIHPAENPKSHINIESRTVEEITHYLKEVWSCLP